MRSPLPHFVTLLALSMPAGADTLTEVERAIVRHVVLTFNPGVALGGTAVSLDAAQVKGEAAGKSNVVAERMVVAGDLRTISPEKLEWARTEMRAITAAHLPHTAADIRFDDGYPPMAPSEGNRRLLALYDQVSRDLGYGPVGMDNPAKAGAADVSFVAGIVPMASSMSTRERATRATWKTQPPPRRSYRQGGCMRYMLAAGVVVAGLMAGDAAAADVLALIEQAKTAARRKDPAAVVKALQDALQEARRAAPLVADPFVLVAAKAPAYGGYEQRQDAVFRGDEAMLFYLEPKNLVYPRNDQGTFTPGLAIDLEILDAAGTVVGRKERFGVFPFASRSPLQDIYVNLEVSLTGAPPGDYEIRFVLHDMNSAKTTTVAQKVTRK